MTSIKTKARAAATHYDTLGCAPACTARELRDAYYQLARDMHRRGQFAAGFPAVTLAYGVLKVPSTRKQYDDRLRLEGVLDCPKCKGAGLRSTFRAGQYIKGYKCIACGGRGHL